MKKLALLFVLLISPTIFSQTEYTKVLDLLIDNNREEARKLFDKQFSKSKNNNIDLLFLDAIIEEQSGKVDFDESFLKSIENLPNSQFYIPLFINSNLVLNDISQGTNNDLTYKKIDFLSHSPKFKNLPIVKYRKAVFERIRKRYEEGNETFKSLNAISKWQFCGVFENLNGSGLDIEYEPEKYAKNDKQFDANSNGIIGWYNPKKSQDDPYHFFGNEKEYGNGIIYAQTFIQSTEDKEYLLSFGANKSLKIFLNDQEIYVNQDLYRTNLDAYTIKIKLNKGFNRLLFKFELGNGFDYFSAQIKNLEQEIEESLVFYDTFQPYTVSNQESICLQEIPLDYELYFENLVKNNPKNILYKLFLFHAYLSNNKKVKAFEALDGLNEKYPKSSYINTFYIAYYGMFDDQDQKIVEITKSLESNDPDYFFVKVSKLIDAEWLKSQTIEQLEKHRDISKNYKQKYAYLLFDFMIASRKNNVDEMLQILDKLIENSYNNETFLILAANLHYSLKKDPLKPIQILEEIVKTKDIEQVNNLLIEHYQNLNRKEDIKQILTNKIKHNPYLNAFRDEYIEELISENKYEDALLLIDENLSYFPYSFTNFQQKSFIYSNMKNYKEAEKYIRKSLIYNSANSKLRNQLYDITKKPDEIEEIATKDVYELIKKRKGSTLKTEYGVVVLLDEYIVNILPEGGMKSKMTFVYEITAEKGIEELKEYSIDSYHTILKSEVIKTNGTIVPAERGSTTLVFSDLKVGDIIYISYEAYGNSSGRFYKDFNHSCYLNSYYPMEEVIFGLIHPKDKKYNTYFSINEIPSSSKNINNNTYTIWKNTKVASLPVHENYAPVFDDIANYIRVSTISSWKEISNWYADLVKKNVKIDKITTDTFNLIFPNGYKQFSEMERAKKIYTYIGENIKYSSLDFRQSGYIPQKPSKTITTKLGDCKDVSTLFVVLSELAGLQSNLVLILTNDNGFKSLSLPSKDFNHCIVKTKIDNKDVFLELTDKYLPFMALPNSLFNSNALVISFDKTQNENSKLINIPFENALKNSIKTNVTIQVNEDSKIFTNNHKYHGAGKSYYNELFSNTTSEETRKKDLEKNYNKTLNKVISLDSYKVLSKNNMFDENLEFETQFSIKEKLQKVGNLKIIEIPFSEKIYTRDLIETETRKFDINYFNYESYNEYETEVILNIEKEKKFVEIPENKSFHFKDHNYSISYILVADNSLKINRKATISWNVIKASEYLEFKKFVEAVIETEEQIIGFK